MTNKTGFKSAVAALALCLSTGLQASYQSHEQAQAFVQRMASEHGFDTAYVSGLLARAERKQAILDAISRPAEKVLTWKDYRKIFLDERRIAQGREFLQQYKVPLARAELQFGVPAHIIAAIIGVETRYGQLKGSYRVLDALATLAFDYPPRSKFFTSELEQYLLLVKEQGFKAEELMGSYAGAMGFGQFISSSYRHYAVDFDGDGIADIINNPIDAIGSVANYFSKHGWQSGEAVTVTATINDKTDRDLANQSLKPQHSLQDIQAGGFQPSFDVDINSPATAMILQGEQGDEAWIGFKNFYVITRYNHSKLYAMAVFQLSESIK
ncbi:lytic murein transglycosylase B [Dasania sp. GY-MA-18]|uniref:Lytic murein transglycosylase B n=1 Tax=Dasania phycosphaerae TaxID=2950436 RepID=A0A9J6RI13_9GAMM|nr:MULTISPECIES: lytic murein transglycosylase B [Dasania]MCR8921209.1 lytic murein transglycosylase B [Dasania sp. GY-MA-18]MCZ0863637.1 lytic murein transglycosylase B [Dasania phycosphaerae]MCZ0867365.1 lytic murein transglycosylase B [Dasania phycosphaerae]